MFKGMLNILFPKYCPGCNLVLPEPEVILCIACRNELPRTHYHTFDDPSVINKFYGRLPLNHGTALLHYYKKGLTQRLIHALKYKGQKEIGEWLGRWLGEELKSLNHYRELSGVVPVPMHPKKLRQRGFNQAAIFGQALAQALNIPCFETLLIQNKIRQTQAKQGRWGRWSKAHEFSLNPLDHPINYSEFKRPESLKLLLVDDVITTGATMEACGNILVRELGASLSCASIAIA